MNQQPKENGMFRSNFNSWVERVFGFHPTECVGNNVSILMPEPDRSAHVEYLASYMAGGQAKIIGVTGTLLKANSTSFEDLTNSFE